MKCLVLLEIGNYFYQTYEYDISKLPRKRFEDNRYLLRSVLVGHDGNEWNSISLNDTSFIAPEIDDETV